MTIPTYRLPPGVERGSQFGPSFRNVIQEAISGVEQRFAQWTRCRGVGDLSYGLVQSDDPLGDYAAIAAIWRAHFGSLIPFRFKDWSDYTATDELLGNGDGTTTNFHLVKTYDPSQILLGTPGALIYVRSITLPVGTPSVFIDGVPAEPGVDYQITGGGMVSFTTAPSNGTTLTWTGEFDVPVRFDVDKLPVVMNEADLASIGSISIKEVIGES
ncbi:DUF2460 domain-containing protein [Bradyrhizobium elkanii]|uniref:DUF2460 domain-containing protein n=1 Tax=Bradyrhizobium elkanii TaxID=29448 RepID=UPI002729952D|nr:DUF2460 domain-containing protein [Bradyrhizobium elkanii]WLA80278.1 DUF2460 domain-containing protein [Bradyrhizobium elkanii]